MTTTWFPLSTGAPHDVAGTIGWMAKRHFRLVSYRTKVSDDPDEPSTCTRYALQALAVVTALTHSFYRISRLPAPTFGSGVVTLGRARARGRLLGPRPRRRRLWRGRRVPVHQLPRGTEHARTASLTSGMAGGLTLSSRTPRPIRSPVLAGSPAISPHTATRTRSPAA